MRRPCVVRVWLRAARRAHIWPPSGHLASLRPIARLAPLGNCNLEAIWQDIKLASNGLPSLAKQAIWQSDFQCVNTRGADKYGYSVHTCTIFVWFLLARLPGLPDCPIGLFARLARLCRLPDWPDSAQCPTRPTAACPTETDCIICPTRPTGLARLLPDCH